MAAALRASEYCERSSTDDLFASKALLATFFRTNSFISFLVPPSSSFLAALRLTNTLTSTAVCSERNVSCSKQTPISFSVFSRGRKFFELECDVFC